MIFNNHVDLQIIRKFTQAPDPVSCQFHLFVPGPSTAGIYPDGMTVQEPGRFHPAIMIADGLFTAGPVRVPAGNPFPVGGAGTVSSLIPLLLPEEPPEEGLP